MASMGEMSGEVGTIMIIWNWDERMVCGMVERSRASTMQVGTTRMMVR